MKTESTPSPDLDVQEHIEALLKTYNITLANELQNGDTIEVHDPVEGTIRLLTGKSAAKIEALWQTIILQTNELSARPKEEREKAVRIIQSIEPGDVTYLDQDRSSYDMITKLERYQTTKFFYSVNIATNQIVEITLVDEFNINLTPLFTQNELEIKAREFITRVAPNTNLAYLTPNFGTKGSEIFFFRWEDHSRHLTGEMYPFIQIGLSQGGDLVHYVNTLQISTISSTTTTMSFSEIYANGGNYWQWVSGSYNVKNNAGYCYIYGWCSPKNFYYQNTCFGCMSAKGRWKPNPNPTVKARAFIPSTHATTPMACYESYYNGGSSWYEKCINQYIYYNAFVVITSNSLINIRRIDLSNTSDSSTTKEIAWDEIHVYTP
ncbi:MAG: hypothetical protein ACPL0B_00515 [Anaerolineales bacterium]